MIVDGSGGARGTSRGHGPPYDKVHHARIACFSWNFDLLMTVLANPDPLM
jgi:hypothetical protein